MQVFKSAKGKEAVYASYDNLLKLWQVPVEQSDLETSYGKIHVILVGDKKLPPLILFHGVGDNSAIMWINNAILSFFEAG
ncbi:MAG: hypothetical protein JXJ04_18395 [Spirochaetales bacterium]|nr:hypothetical protein [Spirochaetales bacterium]